MQGYPFGLINNLLCEGYLKFVWASLYYAKTAMQKWKYPSASGGWGLGAVPPDLLLCSFTKIFTPFKTSGYRPELSMTLQWLLCELMEKDSLGNLSEGGSMHTNKNLSLYVHRIRMTYYLFVSLVGGWVAVETVNISVGTADVDDDIITNNYIQNWTRFHFFIITFKSTIISAGGYTINDADSVTLQLNYCERTE